jgi:hypothetical protein
MVVMILQHVSTVFAPPPYFGCHPTTRSLLHPIIEVIRVFGLHKYAMTDTNNSVDMMDGAYLAPGDKMVRSTTTADVWLDGGDLVLNSTKVTCDKHHLDSKVEKQEETETTTSYNGDAVNNVDMMDEMMGGALFGSGRGGGAFNCHCLGATQHYCCRIISKGK